MKSWIRFGAIVSIAGLTAAGCNEALGTEVWAPMTESEAAPCTPDTLQSNIPAPKLLGPDVDVIEAGEHEFRWEGSAGTYVVEFAYDEKFSNPDSMTVHENKVLYTVRHGGKLHWRVRSDTDCGDSAFSEANALRVTCNPISLRKHDGVHYHRPAIAWNSIEKEYAIVMARSDATGNHLEFMRVKADGTVIHGNDELPKEINIGVDVGTTPNPDITYVPKLGFWAVVAYVENAGFPVAMLLNSEGTIVKESFFQDSPGSNINSVVYHSDPPSVVVSTSSVLPSANVSRIHRLSPDLEPLNGSAILGQTGQTNQMGRLGTLIDLVDSPNAVQSAFVGFELSYPGIENGMHHWTYVERIDWDANGVVKPAFKTMQSVYSGKSVFNTPEFDLGILPAMAANQNYVGITYTRQPETNVQSKRNDVYFGQVGPGSGTEEKHFRLNDTGHEGLSELPKIAWDGSEFFVLWNGEANDHRVIYTSKAKEKDDSKLFKTFGGSNSGLANASIPNSSGKSLVGHDDIHAFVFEEWDDPAYKSISLCIEPPY